MTANVLIAGVGNVFFSDDGFGVHLVRQLQAAPLPSYVRAVDFGIRSLHLSFELLEPLALLVVLDATQRGGPAGTLYAIDPQDDEVFARRGHPDAHAMNLAQVLDTLRTLGGEPPRTRIIACEVANVGEGMSLSEPVKRALAPAAALVYRILETEVKS